MSRLVLFLLPLAFVLSCVNAPDFPEEPVITYEGADKTEIFQFLNGPADSIEFHFSFTDGDGDLSQDSTDIFFTDSRTQELIPFRIPGFPSEGTGNGISGDVFVRFVNIDAGVCCILGNRICFANEVLPVDTVSYAIQIMDRAGNLSNTIRTDVIEIKCLGE